MLCPLLVFLFSPDLIYDGCNMVLRLVAFSTVKREFGILQENLHICQVIHTSCLFFVFYVTNNQERDESTYYLFGQFYFVLLIAAFLVLVWFRNVRVWTNGNIIDDLSSKSLIYIVLRFNDELYFKFISNKRVV